MLKFDHVHHAYNGIPSVCDVCFEVEAGEVVSLLGPSGCGKTTLLRLAAGLEKPGNGTIYLHDKIISSEDYIQPPEKRGIGYMFQDYALFPHLTVIQNVVFGLPQKGSLATKRGLEALEEVGIGSLGDMYPHELSGGEQQRACIARALIKDPDIILADEPTGNLDPVASFELIKLLEQISQEGTSILMASHNYNLIKSRGHRIVEMQNGSVRQ